MIDVDPALIAFLSSEESRAYDGTLMGDVETALKSYNGEFYGDEEDGRSSVVARDVAEVIDYMLTSVLDAFISSGRVVEFEPGDEADEDSADDATEAMHFLYRRKSGYRLIHDWAKAGLVEKIGLVKTCVERKRQRQDALYHPTMIPANAIEAEETGELHPVDGEPLIRAVTLEQGVTEFRDYFVPLEEFRVSPDARDLDEAVYVAHITRKSLSDLRQMGFSFPDSIADDGPAQWSITARDDGRQSIDYAGSDRMGALRQVWLREEYVLYDLNGDGIAERLCIHRVGSHVLAIDEVDYQPFEYWCPFPMQGRLIGQSLADKTIDIQRVNTILERNALDSLYMNVAPGTMIHEDSIGDHTVEDLLTIRPRRIVRWTGAQPPVPERPNDISSIAFQAIEFKIRQRESRTGITRLNKGVDEDTINQTASGQAQLMARGQQIERYVIRNFAEGVARLFMKKIGLMRRYGQPFRIRVDGEYRIVDPSQWPENMETNVQVGLGSGSKDERIMRRQMIGQVQAMLKQAGSPIITDENLYNNAIGLARDSGLAPNDLFTHPDDNPQPETPDPAVMKLQAELQLKQQQLMQAQQEAQAKLALMVHKHESDAAIAAARAKIEADIALRQQNLQAWLDAHQMALDAHKSAREADVRQSESNARIARMRPGGSLAK